MPGPSGLAVILTTITPCFAGYTMSVNLYIASGAHQEFTNSEENLKTDFNFERAVVTAGTWIFYKHANFNNKESGGNSGDHKILNPGASEDIKSVNGSMYLVRDQTEGIILFTHAYYGGKNKWYEEYCADVNPDFQSGTGKGVSSAIVLSKNQSFDIFAKPNFQGLEQRLNPGQWYATPNAMGFPNDLMQSFRKI
ncbi:uncharacterized protein [Montipora foliosa]|uniref:uncharacterized protein isoform X1 n=2 Tax=Montipora foliosa TaxID=591990 RepID=UPI0035F1A2FA